MPSNSSSPDLAAAGRTAASDTGLREGSYLSVTDVSLRYADRRVLSNITFTANHGDRIGLVGENGTGKSTLLRILAAQQQPSSGSISLPGSVGLLAQQLPYPDDAPISRVLDDAQAASLEVLASVERLGTHLAEHPNDVTIANEYANALESAEASDAWSAQAHRGEMLTGLGLGGLSESRQLRELSGGQRNRLALAALLLRAPHTLLLDEPSNHLDDASAAYLERVLVSWPGIVMFASHDRALLDSVASKILDLDPLPVTALQLADAAAPNESDGSVHRNEREQITDDTGSGFGVRLWGTGYSTARAEREAEMRRWRERYRAETAELEELEHEILVGAREVNRKHESKSESRISRKFYADKDARVTSRRARNARVRRETLERERVRRPPEPLRFSGFLGDTELGHTELGHTETKSLAPSERGASEPFLLRVENVAHDGRLAPVSFKLRAGDSLLLTGPNGAGKSTLLAALAGEFEPSRGAIERGAAVGYLPQEVVFAEIKRSAAEIYRSAVGSETADRIPLEASGLLAARDLHSPATELSVGQQRRLALAILVATSPPVLLLDEPTNHLSLTLVEELEDALRDYPGALVIASHDRWLRSRWDGEVRSLRGR